MEKIKLFIESEGGKDILTVVIVILVGLSCFELGRLSNESGSSGIKILSAQAGESPNQNGSQDASTILSEASFRATPSSASNISSKTLGSANSAGKSFFASSKGSKYYSVGCSAGKTIKQENRVYFATGEEAQAAGYTLSGSCR